MLTSISRTATLDPAAKKGEEARRRWHKGRLLVRAQLSDPDRESITRSVVSTYVSPLATLEPAAQKGEEARGRWRKGRLLVKAKIKEAGDVDPDVLAAKSLLLVILKKVPVVAILPISRCPSHFVSLVPGVVHACAGSSMTRTTPQCFPNQPSSPHLTSGHTGARRSRDWRDGRGCD